jgi:hypothetical protein
MPKVAFKECDVTRALKAAEKAGLTVSGYEVTPEGVIRVLTGAAPAPNAAPVDDYGAWRKPRGERAA